jgi:hypothetical protein
MQGSGDLRFRKSLEMSHDTEETSSKRKFRKYDTAIDTSCAFETNDLNFTTANFDSYGNLSFDPCEYGNHRVLLLAFDIHMRKTIPKIPTNLLLYILLSQMQHSSWG